MLRLHPKLSVTAAMPNVVSEAPVLRLVRWACMIVGHCHPQRAANGPQLLDRATPAKLPSRRFNEPTRLRIVCDLPAWQLQFPGDSLRLIRGKHYGRRITDLRETADKTSDVAVDLQLIRTRKGRFKYVVCEQSRNRANLLQVFT